MICRNLIFTFWSIIGNFIVYFNFTGFKCFTFWYLLANLLHIVSLWYLSLNFWHIIGYFIVHFKFMIFNSYILAYYWLFYCKFKFMIFNSYFLAYYWLFYCIFKFMVFNFYVLTYYWICYWIFYFWDSAFHFGILHDTRLIIFNEDYIWNISAMIRGNSRWHLMNLAASWLQINRYILRGWRIKRPECIERCW